LPGYFLPVLHRNTTLPVRRVERVSTLHAMQRTIQIDVYQGEHRYVSQNRLLGSFEISDLPPGTDEKDRESVDLAFVHDLNGLLQVEATVVSTGEKAKIVIEQRAGRMTDAQLRAARSALERLNVHPRDLLPNRLLLEHAHTRHLRLNLRQRELLDPVLLAFEDALERQDTVAVAEAGQALEAVLAHPALTPEAPKLQ
jgi:molecular chaperone HscC